ncbi:MAG: DUF4268 domain-containing protein [Planctomycetes bacterium]|nr:DUF4268 domain-containing protein [Planctomycetota bacterium]MBI3844163.1 DUF4268 domain-containing protein [Planctomycetota bacterium]
MEAGEAKIQRVLEGSKQFLIPHFQRPYSWREEQWKTLWHDLEELLDDPHSKPHFLGPIVSAPARSVPEGVEKRLLIDGQQRLTTLIILLILVRDQARNVGESKLADKIQDLITNRHEEGHDRYKLLPTQGDDPADSDRDTFIRLIEGGERRPSKTGINAAYGFFATKLRRGDQSNLEALQRAITSRLTLVSIILDEKDNPHRIFESLNGKGRPLSQADLIRNYFFMRLPEPEHDRVYLDLWRPMQKRLGEEALTDFVRHYLTQSGTVVRESDVYSGLKAIVDDDSTKSPLEHLTRLNRFSEFYEVLLRPEKAPSNALRERLLRLNRLEVTVAYPFVLRVYADMASGSRAEPELLAILDVIENFIVRRFVVGVPTHGLNKIFAPLYDQAGSESDFVEAIKRILASKNCPRDDTFRDRLAAARLYGSGERREKTRLILECLEGRLGHKERVETSSLSIEHVMPQSLTDGWKAELGETWDEDHEALLHTLGNLTLTSYNPELSNSPFIEKKQLFAVSHIELNRYFEKVDRWTAKEIERRSEVLTELAVLLWPYFGPEQESVESAEADQVSVKGTVPNLVWVREHSTPVQSWAEVAIVMLESIAAIGDEEFKRVVADLPRMVSFDAGSFRRSSRPRRLNNGAYVETNLSASSIHRLCVQAAQIAGIGPDEWQVVYNSIGRVGDENEAGSADPPTQLKQLQLDFWTQMKPALAATGKFPNLRSPHPRHYYDIALGRTNMYLSLTAVVPEHRVCVTMMLTGDDASLVFKELAKAREAIDDGIGAPLEWDARPDKRNKRIKLTHEVRLIERGTWQGAIEWLTRTAVAFRETFGPRISEIDVKTLRLLREE